ncbi:MAG: AtpZ/AtpI family protein [Myxococcota bacterium]
MNERQRMWRLAGRYSATGIEMAVSVAAGSIGGSWLDSRFDIAPWGVTLGILLGLALAVKTVMRVVTSYQRELARSGNTEPD